MTRGVGTALGVALTGAVFGRGAGTAATGSLPPGPVRHGFTGCLLFLAGLSVLAAALAAGRGRPVGDLAGRPG